MRVAFVLSGGASLGASQAGMLEALYERDIRPDLMVGTSVGAINAAFVASRPANVETARHLQRIWRGLSRGDIFPASLLRAGLGCLGLRDHSVSSNSLRRVVSRHLEVTHLEDAEVDLHVVAADAVTGQEILLSAGPAVDAVLASAAIPGVFPPVQWQSRLLIDGAVVNNSPISHAVELGADRIFVLHAMTPGPLTRAPRGVFAAGAAAVSRILAQRFETDVARYARAVELVILPAAHAEGIMPTDFSHADELIASARARARVTLDESRRVVRLPRAA
jgi:NTE family protein